MKNTISASVPRFDADKKLSGEAVYIGDMVLEGMLHARTVRSDRAHARIKSMHLPELPEGYFAVSKDDITGKNHMQSVVSDHPLFADEEVFYIGQPLLLIVGPDKETTASLATRVKIDYEDLPAITEMEEAIEQNETHVSYHYDKGNPEQAFRESKNIISETFFTGAPDQLYLETNGVIACWENNRMTIYGSMQCPFFVKNAVAEATHLDADQIRVIQVVTGGAFGGKEEFPSLLAAQAATASYKSGKPVRLLLDRKEDLETSTKRHPAKMKYRAAINEKQEITALDIDISFDGGAFATISPVVLQRGMFTATGVYAFPNIRVKGKVMKTHKVPSGAFRGFGAPQVLFAMEQLMNRISQKLNRPSLELKKKSLNKTGDPTATGGKMWSDIKVNEVIEKVIRMSGYLHKKENPGKNRGIGLSLFLHGCGFTGKGEVDISGKVILKKKNEKVSIYTSNVEMGQGPSTTLVKIVSQSLDIPETDISFETQDTDRVPNSGPTVASRTAMIIGGLVKKACNRLREKWHLPEAEVKEVYQHPGYVRWDNKTFKGDAYPVYSWGANIAEVEADPVTCEVHVKKLWGVYDIGVALDEDIIRGQMQGGMIQGLGYALMEKMEHRDGKLLQLNLTDYTIPTVMDTPEIVCDFVENPYEFGPFGAKCAGELPLNGIAPAIAEAAEQALSIKVNRIPMTPEYLKTQQHED